MSIPHEPNIYDQDRKEIMQNLAATVGDACEEWLLRRGLGTKGFRDQITSDVAASNAEKGE